MTATSDASALSVRPVPGAAAIPADEWSPLARRGAHLYRWCEVAELCGWAPRHVAVHGLGGLQAIIPAYHVRRADHDLHDRWLGPLRDITATLGLHLRPIVAAMTPFIQSSDPLGDLSTLSDGALGQIFEILEERARDDGARAVVWPFVDSRQDRLRTHARQRGYTEVYAGASAYLPVTWGRFDDYVASRSKNVRRTIRDDLRALEQAGIQTEFTTEFQPYADRMADLYRDAFERRNGRPPVVTSDLFRRLAEQSTPGLFAALTRRNAEVVGVSLNPVAGGVLDGAFSAFTPEFQGGVAYHNDLIYAPLRYACQAEVSRLELGATALYPKVLRGARLRRRMTLVRGTNPALHAALSSLGRLVGRRTEQKEMRRLEPLGGWRCFD